MSETVTVVQTINAPLAEVFTWFYRSENFKASPIVMLAGWYFEEITAVVSEQQIDYRVVSSFPPVRQDFTRIMFTELSFGQVKVTWQIELSVKPFSSKRLDRLAGKMARLLYQTILDAGKKALERSL
ncbi:SRPBCC family protein [Ligilactobacillus faecis]|uniref:SRPBCC family protein n=1 Tax=Ligilactobacillus faecis TaxID=762833 RepID=A0ABV4DNQ7_9LACO